MSECIQKYKFIYMYINLLFSFCSLLFSFFHKGISLENCFVFLTQILGPMHQSKVLRGRTGRRRRKMMMMFHCKNKTVNISLFIVVNCVGGQWNQHSSVSDMFDWPLQLQEVHVFFSHFTTVFNNASLIKNFYVCWWIGRSVILLKLTNQ